MDESSFSPTDNDEIIGVVTHYHRHMKFIASVFSVASVLVAGALVVLVRSTSLPAAIAIIVLSVVTTIFRLRVRRLETEPTLVVTGVVNSIGDDGRVGMVVSDVETVLPRVPRAGTSVALRPRYGKVPEIGDEFSFRAHRTIRDSFFIGAESSCVVMPHDGVARWNA